MTLLNIIQLLIASVFLLVYFKFVHLDAKYNYKTFYIIIFTAFVLYFGISSIYAYFDIYKVFQDYKIQKDACTSVNQYIKIYFEVILIFLFVLMPFTFVFWIYLMPLRRKLGFNLNTNNFWLFVIGLFVCIIVAELAAWFIHKGMHYFKVLYEMHKYHHAHIAPIAVSAIHAHPFEVIVWDMIPFMMGPLILGGGTSFTYLLIAIIPIVQTLTGHSGYNFYNSINTAFHDLHHERMKCNYAGNMFADRLMGTYMEREPGVIYPKWNEQVKTFDNSKNISC